MSFGHSFTRISRSDPPPREFLKQGHAEESGSSADASRLELRLPNGTVDKAYAADIAFVQAAEAASGSRMELISDPPPGLAFENGTLAGKPARAGEFQMRLLVHPFEPGEHPDTRERLLILTVNPNPQSLWKDIPSNQEEIFSKPDTETVCLKEGPLMVLGVSSRGRSHAHTGAFRDDDLAVAWSSENAWYALIAADGAGSAKFSREGSRLACQSVKDYFAHCLSGEAGDVLTSLAREYSLNPEDPAQAGALRAELYNRFGNAALTARGNIEKQAVAVSAALRDFHTTLMAVLLHPLKDGRWFTAAFSIGDGAAAVTGVPSRGACLLTRPDGGEYAGQTLFLTMKEAWATGEDIMARIHMAVIPEFQAVLLVTDGVSDPRFESENALSDPGAWASLWREIREAAAGADSPEAAAAALLEWMSFHSPGHHDDRTLVLAAPPQALCAL